METGIYEILNTSNNKWYRGQTTDDFSTRWRKHRNLLKTGTHWNEHLQKSWNKYGEESFKFTILARCAPEFCNELEEYWIGEDYNNPAKSYNKRGGGESRGEVSEETRQKLSESSKGENNGMYGKQHTKATKKKISEALKGENSPNYGKKFSEETKQKQFQV